MIKVKRTAKPKKFDAIMRDSRERFQYIYSIERRQRSRRLTKVDLEAFHEIRPDLVKMFRGKCAFCEIREVDDLPHDIHWFRPTGDATDAHGKKTSPTHYWWLAHNWDNLYIVCKFCARKKKNHFPVSGKRVSANASNASLAKEKRQLIDPCVDEPLDEMAFLSDGRVKGRTKRAGTTIQLLGLNRPDLVRRRKKAADHLLGLIALSEELSLTPRGAMTKSERREFKQISPAIAALCADDAEFAGLNRQLISGKSQQVEETIGRGVLRASVGMQFSAQGTLTGQIDPVGSVWIRSVQLENFKALPRISIRFPETSTESGEEPWLVLLGENGLGKSSVLKAISLPFLVQAGIAEQYLDAKDCVRRAPRVSRGQVSLEFSDERVVTVIFGRGIDGFKLEGELPALPMLGYGATRLPPPAGQDEMAVPQRISLGNLFNPRVSLRDAEPWLADPKRVPKATFDKLASAILTLFSASEGAEIERRAGKLYVRLGTTRVLLREMSDGYQSVLALATDIIINMAVDWDSMSSAEGTVLLDEIEVHLHPSWKMKIVSALRSVFPRIRFVVSTHDPLCIQSLNPGELHRLYFDEEDQEVACLQIDVPKGLRADQLLTGSWFGLTTTLDEQTQSLFREYSKLVAKPKTQKNKRRLNELRQTLKGLTSGFNETSMERVAMGAVAEFMENEVNGPDWEPQKARSAIVERLRKMSSRSGRASD